MIRWLLALSFAALLGVGSCCGSDEAVVEEPVDDGTTTTEIVTPVPLVETLFEGIAQLDVSSTYGQFWAIGASEANITLHEGIDFAAPAGTPVRAIERGRVRLVGSATSGYDAQVLVVSEADPSRGWLYVHVDDANRAVEAEIDVIEPGEQLGRISADPTGTAPPHLHLQRVQVNDIAIACPGATAVGTARLYPTLGDPLDELVVPDEVDPEIVEFEIQSDTDPETDGTGTLELHTPGVGVDYLEPTLPAVAAGKDLVLVVQVEDRFLAGGQIVAPKSFELSILDSTGAVVHQQQLSFSGPLRTECGGLELGKEAYMVTAWRSSLGDYTERKFYMRITTRLEDAGGVLDSYSAPWTPEVGQYELTLTVRDASDRSVTETLVLDVRSS